ncbi:MAG: chromosome segregation protein SMC [Clostridiaceae bacterium]|nr:chromosome segregation protein SMC [Clostridiaceae bacterium]
MYLKNLQIQGFKSFVDKINLDFTSGITAIIGPNGSGKSNISDAIRWVMGEQSAKSLRGGNMQDVIFAGTKKRKPLGFAEVSLVIDNSQKKLPIDYEEVMVTRRVFRSGESEYYINKSQCRLKDVHELFMDTGVGKDGYSVIGQGKVSEIVYCRPEDRRQIFEEASGITKYRYRKEEAQRKLSHTQENILRVSDIIGGIQTQLEPLKLQAEKAKKFLNLKEQLKTLEVNVSLEETAKHKKVLEEIDDVYHNNQQQLDAIGAEIGLIEKKNNVMFDEIRQTEEEAEQRRNQQQQSTELLSDIQRDIAVLNNRIEQNRESIIKIQDETKELTEKMYQLDDALSEQDEGITSFLEKDEQLKTQITALQNELLGIEQEKTTFEQSVEKINNEIANTQTQIASQKSLIDNCDTLVDSISTRVLDIEKEISDKKDLFEQAKQKLQQLQTQQKQMSQNEQLYINKSREISAKTNKAEQSLQQAVDKHRDLQLNLQQAKTRQKLLRDMEKSFDNYAYSVKAVMQAKQKGLLDGLFSTVAQLINVPEKYAVAIETVLGASAQNIVVQTEEDAKQAIAFLKKTKAGRATFLPISAAQGGLLKENDLKNQKGVLGIASNLVETEPMFVKIAQNLLGRVVVVDNIDNAIATARKYNYRFRIVTLDGDLITPGGAMSGGSKDSKTGFITLANELLRLNTYVAELEKTVESAKAEELSCQSQLIDLKEQARKASDDLTALQQKYAVLSAEINHSKDFLQSAQQAQDTLFTEKKQLNEKIISMQQDARHSAQTIETLRANAERCNDELTKQKEGLSALVNVIEQKNAEIITCKIEHNNVEKDIELYHERVETVKTRKKELQQAIEQKDISKEEIKDRNEDLTEDIEFKTHQIQETQNDITEHKQQIALLVEHGRKLQERLKTMQAQITEKREMQLVLQQEQGRTEAKKAKAESELESIINYLWEEYELTISTANQYKTEIGSITKAQKGITLLKNQIRDLGNINVDAIGEYANIKERFDFLTSQKNDLAQAGKNLEKVISDMEQIMENLFATKLEEINKQFAEVFADLFGGGTAKLVLTRPDDVLSSGVEIDVQPPGKAVKNMLQLSGGEQAFVSIALLFAILKVKPSPFCIFDEIEASLDEVNVYRFADYLKKFSAISQFIVVTHRRGTMEAANMLYGVTMQEQGVTSLISLNIDDIQLA